MPSKRSALTVTSPKDLHGAVSYTKITDVAEVRSRFNLIL